MVVSGTADRGVGLCWRTDRSGHKRPDMESVPTNETARVPIRPDEDGWPLRGVAGDAEDQVGGRQPRSVGWPGVRVRPRVGADDRFGNGPVFLEWAISPNQARCAAAPTRMAHTRVDGPPPCSPVPVRSYIRTPSNRIFRNVACFSRFVAFLRVRGSLRSLGSPLTEILSDGPQEFPQEITGPKLPKRRAFSPLTRFLAFFTDQNHTPRNNGQVGAGGVVSGTA
jgi:hypothetical protein